MANNYFRTPADPSGFTGSAFAENGHRAVGVKVLSFGLRFVPTASTLGLTAANPGTSCMNIKQTVSTAADGGQACLHFRVVDPNSSSWLYCAVYYIKPSGYSTPFLAYCEYVDCCLDTTISAQFRLVSHSMTTDGGGRHYRVFFSILSHVSILS